VVCDELAGVTNVRPHPRSGCLRIPCLDALEDLVVLLDVLSTSWSPAAGPRSSSTRTSWRCPPTDLPTGRHEPRPAGI